MGLFGGKRLKGGAKLLAIAKAQTTLEDELGLQPAGAAAVVFKPPPATEFVRAESELETLLQTVTLGSASRVRRRSDSYGFEWLVIEGRDFEDLVTTTHRLASELVRRGFGSRLLAATFAFRAGERAVQLIYGFDRQAFWPFVPTGTEQERDNPEEMRLKTGLEKVLPIEQDLTRWLGLFDAPLEASLL
jgi:PspA associated protein B